MCSLLKYEVYVRNLGKMNKKQRKAMYLKTDRWNELRLSCLKRDNYRCRMCNNPAECVHHREYPDILGTETIDALTALCNHCHESFHRPMELAEIREKVMSDKKKKAVKCPVCDQTVKQYSRSLNHGMAEILIIMYKWHKSNPDREYVHASRELCKKGSNPVNLEYSKLRHFGLVEAKVKSGKKGDKKAGYYKITDLGRQFVENKVKVKEKVVTYNDNFLGAEGEELSIKDALENYFDYDTLMKS